MPPKLPLPRAGSASYARLPCASWLSGTAACPHQLEPLARPSIAGINLLDSTINLPILRRPESVNQYTAPGFRLQSVSSAS